MAIFFDLWRDQQAIISSITKSKLIHSVTRPAYSLIRMRAFCQFFFFWILAHWFSLKTKTNKKMDFIKESISFS